MKHVFTTVTAAVSGLIGFAIFKYFSFMYGIIICFNSGIVRVSAPVIGLVLGVAAGIIAAVIADYKDRLLMAEQKSTGQESPEIQTDSFTGTSVPAYRTAYEMHCDEYHLFSDDENTRVHNQQHSL